MASRVWKSLSESARNLFSAEPAAREEPDFSGGMANWNGEFLPPGQPPEPQYPKEQPRSFYYQPGLNLNVLPRAEDSRIPTFDALWAAYRAFPILRAFTTFRSSQILAMDWQLKAREGSGSRVYSEKATEEPRNLLETPDPKNGYDFEQWLRMLLEEVYVTDALSIYPVKARNGKVVAWRIVDGQTVRPLLDYGGNIPTPPEPAYTQFIAGTRFTALTSEELFYRPFRPRTWTVYGQSRVENILMSAILYQLHENYAADYFTMGNIPEAVALQETKMGALMPEKFHVEWQALIDKVSGINSQRRRIHMMPSHIRDVKTLKEFTYNKEMPEFIARMIAIEFGIPIYLIASQTNRATAKEMNEALYAAPLRTDLMSVKRVLDKLLRWSGFEEMEAVPTPQYRYSKEDVEGLVLAATPFPDGTRVMNVSEARERMGLTPEIELASGDVEGGETQQGAPVTGAQQGRGEVRKFPTGETQTQGQDDEGEQEPAAEPAQKALGQTGAGKLKRRAYVGEAAKKRATLAKRFEDVTLKRLRQQEAAIVKKALEQAKRRGKKVAEQS